ncbi:MAG: carboxypeptidase regulatory-like domain-containing protein, partial [Candidatus Thermoplasmatota archaeon]|nr:carboxypeptidase regulatory-like domain-containing protein [Candidatus Thermoplasmatota archaeon]
EYFGERIYGDSDYWMGDILVTDNTIESNSTGLYIDEIYDLGYRVENNAKVRIGDIHIDRNTVNSLGEGIYLYDIDYFGEDVRDEASVRIGNFTVNDNIIDSVDEGIYVGEFYKFGSDLNGTAEVSMRSIQLNGNQITSSEKVGLYIDEIQDFGRRSEENSSYSLGSIQIRDNDIESNLTGIMIDDFKDPGDGMIDQASFTIGGIFVADNTISNNHDYGIDMTFSGMGNDMKDNSTFTIEEVVIANNTLDTEEGIKFCIESSKLTHYPRFEIGKVDIIDNTMGSPNIIGINVTVDMLAYDNSELIVGPVSIHGNEIHDASMAAVWVHETRWAVGDAVNTFGPISMVGNNFTGSAVGLQLNGTHNALAYLNNFIGNTQDLSFLNSSCTWTSPEPMWYKHGMANYSSIMGNYWDRYSGTDDNDDGIGETPYGTGHGRDTYPLTSNVDDYLPPWNDVTPPDVFITFPNNGDALNVQNINFEWSGVDDLLGIGLFEVKVDDGPWIDVGMATSREFTNLSEGLHEFHVKATDMAGNWNQTSITFSIDITDPTLNITYPSDGSAFNTTMVTIMWEGSDEPLGIETYRIAVGNSSWTELGIVYHHNLTLPQGYHIINVNALDMAGNQITKIIRIYVDLVDPTVNITYPADGMLLAGSAVNATWEGSDDLAGVLRYEVKIDGGNWSSAGLDTSYMFEGLSSGQHTLVLRVFDRAMNHDTAETTFMIDSEAPRIIHFSHEGSGVKTRGPLTLQFSEEMDEGTLNLTLDGEEVEWALNDAGNFLTIALDEPLSAGEDHSLAVMGADLAGNSITGSLTFTTATTGTITGRIVDDEGEPVEGARIVLDTGEETTTDSNGVFTMDAPGGTRTVTVYDGDEEIGVFTVEVYPGEPSDAGDQEVEPVVDGGSGSSAFLIILLAVIVLALVGVLVFMIFSRRNKIDEEDFDDEDEDEDFDEDEEDFDEDDEDFDEDEEDFDDDEDDDME